MKWRGKNKIAEAGIGYVLGNYLIKGITFFSTPIFARILTTSEYGIYNTYVSIEAIIFVLLGLAVHTSLKNARYKFDIKQYISSVIVLVGINYFIYFILGNYFFDSYSKYLYNNRMILNLLLMQAFGSSMIYIFNSFISLEYDYRKFLMISSCNAIFNISISFGLIIFLPPSQRYIGRIVGTAVPVIVIGLILCSFFWKKSPPKINKEHWKFALSYSLPIVPHGISQVVLSQFDRIMISAMVGTEKTGIYGFSASIVSIITITADSLGNVWNTWFYDKMQQKQYREINKYSQIYAGLVLILVIILGLASPEMLYILGGTKYEEAIYVTLPLLFGAFLSFYYSIPVQVEYYERKTTYIAVATILAALLNIGLNYIFIFKFGYMAAAYTTEFTYGMYFLFHYLIAKKICRELYPIKDICRILIAAFAAQLMIYVFMPYLMIRWIMIFSIIIYMYCRKDILIKNKGDS